MRVSGLKINSSQYCFSFFKHKSPAKSGALCCLYVNFCPAIRCILNCRGRVSRHAFVCTSPRLRVDVGIDPYKCDTAQICAKLRADMESAPTVRRKFTANYRGRRPLRPALAEGNVSHMMWFLWRNSNLCRGELRSSDRFAQTYLIRRFFVAPPSPKGEGSRKASP